MFKTINNNPRNLANKPQTAMESLQKWAGFVHRSIRRGFHCVIMPNVCEGEKGTWSKIIRRTAGARGLTVRSRKSSATSWKHQTGPRTPQISETHRILEVTFTELYLAKSGEKIMKIYRHLPYSPLFILNSCSTWQLQNVWKLWCNIVRAELWTGPLGPMPQWDLWPPSLNTCSPRLPKVGRPLGPPVM